MDRLQALKVFVMVAQTESFTAGAKMLGLSASSATRAINELEENLSARLFTRTTRRVRLTDVGQNFLEEVREVLAQLQAAENAVTGAADKPAGQLRITCPQELGRFHVAPLVARFLDAFPQVSVDLLLVDRNVNLVEEGYDAAIRIGELPSSGLMALRVGTVRRVLCGSPDYFARHGLPTQPGELSPGAPVDFDRSVPTRMAFWPRPAHCRACGAAACRKHRSRVNRSRAPGVGPVPRAFLPGVRRHRSWPPDAGAGRP